MVSYRIISPLGWPDAPYLIEVEHIKGVKSPDDEQVTKKKCRGSAGFLSDNLMMPLVAHCFMKDESLIL